MAQSMAHDVSNNPDDWEKRRKALINMQQAVDAVGESGPPGPGVFTADLWRHLKEPLKHTLVRIDASADGLSGNCGTVVSRWLVVIRETFFLGMRDGCGVFFTVWVVAHFAKNILLRFQRFTGLSYVCAVYTMTPKVWTMDYACALSMWFVFPTLQSSWIGIAEFDHEGR